MASDAFWPFLLAPRRRVFRARRRRLDYSSDPRELVVPLAASTALQRAYGELHKNHILRGRLDHARLYLRSNRRSIRALHFLALAGAALHIVYILHAPARRLSAHKRRQWPVYELARLLSRLFHAVGNIRVWTGHPRDAPPLPCRAPLPADEITQVVATDRCQISSNGR